MIILIGELAPQIYYHFPGSLISGMCDTARDPDLEGYAVYAYRRVHRRGSVCLDSVGTALNVCGKLLSHLMKIRGRQGPWS